MNPADGKDTPAAGNVTPIRPGADATPRWVAAPGTEGNATEWDLDLRGLPFTAGHTVSAKIALVAFGAVAVVRVDGQVVHQTEHPTLVEASQAAGGAVVMAEKLRWRP